MLQAARGPKTRQLDAVRTVVLGSKYRSLATILSHLPVGYVPQQENQRVRLDHLEVWMCATGFSFV